jgi:3,4-dihydroxy 2-butanone 4-phosphate synthase/GTP cyclohydrolase II
MGTAQTGPLWCIASTRMPARWGLFEVIGYERDVSNGTHRVETALAIVLGDLTERAPLVRVHSQCFTGEILGSLRCDCGDQLTMAMQAIAEEGCGVVIYEYQEGRGIGLMAKLQAYELQDGGIDTVEANHALGFKADCRDFSLADAILHDLGVRRVRLLTNNPRKVRSLSHAGIEIVARIPCEVAATPHSFHYLRTKKEKMGHALTFPHGAGIRDGESACIGESASELQWRSGSVDEILTLLCGEHGRAIDAGGRVRGIEAQL